MQELSADIQKLEKLFKKITDEFPGRKKELFQKMAPALKKLLDQSILATDINDSHGHIRGYQQYYLGSGGGYAAVRAQKGKTGRDSPGAITNYLENGHKARTRGYGSTAKFRTHGKGGRALQARVRGRHFYYNSTQEVEALALKLGTEFMRELEKELNQ